MLTTLPACSSAASRRLPVNVFPVVAELAFLFSHDEVGRIRMLLEPRAPAHGAQLWESCGKAAAAHDAIGVLNFHHAVRFLRIAAVAQILDDVGSCVGNRDQNFARPLLGEMRRAHDNRGKRLGVGGHVCDACSGHKGLPCPALAHDLDCIVICKVLHAPHDGEFLCRQGFTHQARQLRSGGIARCMQWGVHFNYSAAE